MMLLLFSCKKDLGIPVNGLQADHKNDVLATRPMASYVNNLKYSQ